MYRWRNIRLEFTQVATNKAPVSPNRGYSRMQHLWFTERVIDIVAHELELDPVEVRKRNYIQRRGHAVRDAERLRLRLRRLRADARHRARADRLRRASRSGARRRRRAASCSASASARRSTPARTTSASRGMINPELQFSGNNEVATVKLDIFGEIVVTLGTTPQGQGHETTAAQVVADILGCSVDDVHVRAGPRLVLELARRLLRHVRVAVRGHRALSAVKGATDMLARGDQASSRARSSAACRRRRSSSPRAASASRTTRRRALPFMALRRDHQREQRRPAGGPRRHAQLPLRLPAAVRGAGRRAQVRQPDAHVRGADPRRRHRDRSRRPATTTSSTTRPSTTAASASTRRSSRAR